MSRQVGPAEDMGRCVFWILIGCAAVCLAMGGCGYLWDYHDKPIQKQEEKP